MGGASDVFQSLSWRWSGAKGLTADEMGAFGTRFRNALAEDSKTLFGGGLRSLWSGFWSWKDSVSRRFNEEKPAISERLVNFVNGAALGWTAKYHPVFSDRSRSKFKNMLGLDVNDTEQSELLEEAHRLRAQDLAVLGVQSAAGEASTALQEPEGPFAVWDKWPQCGDVMRHVRFQTCPNCWSHSTALITESRVCIKSGGRFVGRDAWLSQSYIAACRLDGRDYCNAAGGTLGYRTVTQWGVPTGASDGQGNADKQASTCYPQIPAHLSGIQCPASCEEGTKYPRDIQRDTFFLTYQGPRALHPGSDLTQVLAKRALMEGGPIMVGFTAHADLQAYTGGIYRPAQTTENYSLGGHAVTAMGFGPGYYLCTNSWGDWWGDKGTFMIATDFINIGYYIPGQLDYGKFGRFPLPVPR